ncbi:hypothetical protein ACQP00_49955 [Dactylosporangium sp. CS-047395]|uniref:hypothetical protein n=1 Tax=Dactylosporangium sp. CS-047395 TaxID=3239936 RepID=UPI003D8A539B
MFFAVLVTFAVVVGWLGRSVNTYRHPEATPTPYHREVKREARDNVVRGWLWVAVLCPVMFVTLYTVIHSGAG